MNSIEIRWPAGPDGRDIITDLGEIEWPEPRPDRGQVGPLMLTTPGYVAKLKADGPTPTSYGAMHGVTTRGGSDFAYIDYRGRRWVWELLEAHFSDGEGPDILIGRWPD
ncbi:MAG: hypothetical protein KDB47_06975 [Mycobacterium sp.]|nr:hypothetical protein [Mycobacterium sp.]